MLFCTLNRWHRASAQYMIRRLYINSYFIQRLFSFFVSQSKSSEPNRNERRAGIWLALCLVAQFSSSHHRGEKKTTTRPITHDSFDSPGRVESLSLCNRTLLRHSRTWAWWLCFHLRGKHTRVPSERTKLKQTWKYFRDLSVVQLIHCTTWLIPVQTSFWTQFSLAQSSFLTLSLNSQNIRRQKKNCYWACNVFFYCF